MENVASGDNLNASSGSTEDKVSYETYQKVLAEAKAAKEKARAFEAAAKAAQEDKLKEQNEWKLLAEQREKDLLEERKARTEIEGSIVEAYKRNAFIRQLGGRLKNDRYFDFVDTDRIVYNPETKQVDESSVKSVVADFLREHSSLVESKAGKMPNVAPGEAAKFGVKEPDQMTSEEIMNELRKFGKI